MGAAMAGSNELSASGRTTDFSDYTDGEESLRARYDAEHEGTEITEMELCYPGSLLFILFAGQDGGEVAQFFVQIGTVGQGARNLLAIEFAEPFPQAMHCDTGRAFVQTETRRHRRIIRRAARRHEASFERVKVLRLARRRGVGRRRAAIRCS